MRQRHFTRSSAICYQDSGGMLQSFRKAFRVSLGYDKWIHNECSKNTDCTSICPKCEFFNFSDSFFGEQVNLEPGNSFVPLKKETKKWS